MKKVIFVISLAVFGFGVWAIATNRQQAYSDAVFMDCQNIYPGDSAADAINRESCNNRAKGDDGLVPILAIVFGGIGMFATFQSFLANHTDKKE